MLDGDPTATVVERRGARCYYVGLLYCQSFFSCCLSNLSSRTDLGLELGPSGILDHSPVARVEKT